jgi:hypothetical protein
MENYIVIDNKTYKAQSLWRDTKKDKKLDDDDKRFPYPKESKPWIMSNDFIKRLQKLEVLIEEKKPENEIFYDSPKDCLLCDKKNITTKQVILGKYLWEDGLKHYVKIHNIKPSEKFIDFIFNADPSEHFVVPLVGRVLQRDALAYLKLEKNQIMILDALMKHGGYSKKYHDPKRKNFARYSEHAGFFEIKNKIIYDIIVAGNTLRVDKGDEEIFLPNNMPDAMHYPYLFHTHPATPYPGGRANQGIIFEFPSIGDILHFIDHYNMGKTIGSLVMTPEGLYNIRKHVHDGKEIKINEDALYDEIRKEISYANRKSIQDFGIKFDTYTFYTKIAQDTSYLEIINKKLIKYQMFIDYFPRQKDFKGSWIVDTVYLPLYSRSELN